MFDDKLPELAESFQVALVSTVSGDGKPGSSPTSGASIDPKTSVNLIKVTASDHPYGIHSENTLLYFQLRFLDLVFFVLSYTLLFAFFVSPYHHLLSFLVHLSVLLSITHIYIYIFLYLHSGLLQFQPSPPPVGLISPALEPAHITVNEEAGQIHLPVARAQGLLGRIMVGYRTTPFTASSPEDYEVYVSPAVFLFSKDGNVRMTNMLNASSFRNLKAS